jgi:type 1 glutamine amidotransferase
MIMKNLTRRAFTRGLALALAAICTLPALAADKPKKLLVVTITTGFRHSSIGIAEKTLSKLAQKSGQFTVEFVQQPPNQPRNPQRPKPGTGPNAEKDPKFVEAMTKFQADEKKFKEDNAVWMKSVEKALEKLSPANLKNYDGVIFANTTGDLPLPDKQGFIDWVNSGKAFMGMHSATDTFHGFRPFIDMIGGEFQTHGPQVQVDCLNQDPAHAACKHLPASWTVFDEIYIMKSFERAKVRGLLGLNAHPNDKTKAGDYPVAWCKAFGQGRVFYTSLGHREDMWDTEEKNRKNSPEIAKQYQQHILGGILWALKLAPGDAQPQPIKL